jgi:integrase
MTKIKLTKAAVDKLTAPSVGRVEYFDTELNGFGCRISASSKTYFVLKRVNGKLSRVTLGKHGILTPDEARKLAIEAMSKMNRGIDIAKEKAQARDRGMKVCEVLDSYFISRTNLKPRTEKTYRDLFRLYLSDWLNAPIAEITKDMVARRHLKIAQKAGEPAANNAMRTFRAIYNFANELLDDTLPVNPVKRLSNTRQWYKVGRKQTLIKETDLANWYAAVNEINNPTIRDYLLLLLLTGARRSETASIRWDDVDMTDQKFVLQKTKNGKPLYLPMSDTIYDLFQRRAAFRENDFVFPGTGKTGHLVEPRKQMGKVTAATGISFTVHDMRRTYASAIDGIVGYYDLKRLLNHSVKTDDVTAGYVIKEIDKLRPLMQRVTDHIMNLCLPPEPCSNVLPFRKSAEA